MWLLQLGLCPEASNHLQDMKDKLICISNDLLDNVTNLSPDQVENLRKERFTCLSYNFLLFWVFIPPRKCI